MFLSLAVALAQPPPFQVRNLCPPAFTVVNKMPAAVPAPAKPARNLDPDHTCDKCGTYQPVVSRSYYGLHSHVCGKCGNEWWHPDPGAVRYMLPTSQSSCPSGGCPPATTGYLRRGLFR
jgi:hypothetical protein